MLILNQLSPDLGSRRLKLNLKWRPRDGNQGADDFTYVRFSGLVQALLGYILWSEVEKDVLVSLLDSSRAFEQEVVSLRAQNKSEQSLLGSRRLKKRRVKNKWI